MEGLQALRGQAPGRRAALAAITSAVVSTPGRLRAQGARVLRVGPGLELATVADAARKAADGDLVEIVAGDYRGDVTVWLQQRLTIRAVGGPVRLMADGQAAERKAIWVIRNGDVDITGVEFSGVRVSHRNGAGIRLEGGSLTVRQCRFLDSECGILTGGGSRFRSTRMVVERCEFAHLGDGEGQAHGIYAGDIGMLRVVGSYFHHGRVGHHIKSRAALSDIRYNRITDEAEGRASYEIDLPNGGVAVVVGNLVQQGPLAENWTLLTFGQEGYRPAPNRLFVASNTFVNDRPRGGLFVRVSTGADQTTLINNVWCGLGGLQVSGELQQLNNAEVSVRQLLNHEQHDYRLREGREPWRYVRPLLTEIEGMRLVPDAEYRHPCQVVPAGTPPDRPGALQSRTT